MDLRSRLRPVLRLAGLAAMLAALCGPAPAQDFAQAQPRPPSAAPAAQMPLPPRAVAQKSFQRSDLVSGARRYERHLRREVFPAAPPLDKVRRDAAQAMQRNDPRTAAELYASLAMADPQDAATWLRLARALSAIKPGEGKTPLPSPTTRWPPPISPIAAPVHAQRKVSP